MDVAYGYLILSFVIWFYFPHTQRNSVGLSVGNEFESSTFDKLSDSLGK